MKGDKELLIKSLDNAMKFAASQLRNLLENHPDYFPMYTVDGEWGREQEAWTNWCEGFLIGQLWIMYSYFKDPWWREQAEHYCRLIEHRKSDQSVHDLGFLFWPSWKRWYEMTGDPSKNRVVIEAGQTLAKRFMKSGEYLHSFVAKNSLFIDIMMNVGIIFYAAEQLEDPALAAIAHRHCQTTRRFLVRGDGSTAHEGIFDLESGMFLHQSTHQGWRRDSCWARGQAWALSGFGTAYQMTSVPEYLTTAERCADFYIMNLPANSIPPNDFDEPNPELPYESSAAAIAANGLLKLAELTKEPEKSARYLDTALATLETLSTPDFLGMEPDGWEGIIKHGIYHRSRGIGVDESVMWGDYFFLEAASFVLVNHN